MRLPLRERLPAEGVSFVFTGTLTAASIFVHTILSFHTTCLFAAPRVTEGNQSVAYDADFSQVDSFQIDPYLSEAFRFF